MFPRPGIRRSSVAVETVFTLSSPRPHPTVTFMSRVKRGMRRNLTAYGDEEFSLFLRKAFIKAMGYSDDALDRPIIGITNTYSGFNACHRTVPDLIDAVKRGVMLAGGMPVDFPTSSLHEAFPWPTITYLPNLKSVETSEKV